MNEKLISRWAVLLAVAAFGMLTTVAQAAPAKWTKNSTAIANGKTEPTIQWGSFTASSTQGGTITCKTASGGVVENTATEARGSTQLDAAYECKTTGGECALYGGEARVTAKGLPWPLVAEEEGEGTEVYKETSSNVELNSECWTGGQERGAVLLKTGEVEPGFVGTSTPGFQNGATAGRPAQLAFNTKSGHLAGLAEVEVGPKGEKPFEVPNVKVTNGSTKVTIEKGSFITAGVKPGQMAIGLAISIVGGCSNVLEVTEKELVLETPADLTGTFPIGLRPGSGVFEKEKIEAQAIGSQKVEGYEGTPVPVINLAP